MTKTRRRPSWLSQDPRTSFRDPAIGNTPRVAMAGDYLVSRKGRSVSPHLQVWPGLCVPLCAGAATQRFASSCPGEGVRGQDPHRVPTPSRCVALSPPEVMRNVKHAGFEIHTPPANTTHSASVACGESLPRHGPTMSEPTSDTRSGCRWPVERDSGTTIISNFDDHLALGAHHQPELRERQSFEVRTFGAASGASRELVRWKRHGIKHRRLEAIRNLVGRVDDRRARHGCRRSGRRFRRVAGSARHHGQNACHQRDHSHTSTDRSDVSRPLLAATELVPTSYPTGRTPAISSGMPAHCLAPAPVASLSFDHCEYAAPDRGRSAARVGPESQ